MAQAWLTDCADQRAYFLGQRPQDLVQFRVSDEDWVGVLAQDTASGRAVGLAELCHGILSFVVAPPWRHQGVARWLASRALQEHAAARPDRRPSAHALRSNLASCRLLESLDFRVVAMRQLELAVHQRHAVLFFEQGTTEGQPPSGSIRHAAPAETVRQQGAGTERWRQPTR